MDALLEKLFQDLIKTDKDLLSSYAQGVRDVVTAIHNDVSFKNNASDVDGFSSLCDVRDKLLLDEEI